MVSIKASLKKPALIPWKLVVEKGQRKPRRSEETCQGLKAMISIATSKCFDIFDVLCDIWTCLDIFGPRSW
jgi:hypothetical protein